MNAGHCFIWNQTIDPSSTVLFTWAAAHQEFRLASFPALPADSHLHTKDVQYRWTLAPPNTTPSPRLSQQGQWSELTEAVIQQPLDDPGSPSVFEDSNSFYEKRQSPRYAEPLVVLSFISNKYHLQCEYYLRQLGSLSQNVALHLFRMVSPTSPI